MIIALDYDDPRGALDMVDTLGSEAGFYKVGLELFTRAGPGLVETLTDSDKRIFLDLKLHDIPNTVAGAVRSAARTGATMITVHATGGRDMMSAAAEAADGRLAVVAVTVLTSLSRAALAEVLGRSEPDPIQEVRRLARMAAAAGLDGVVCSPQEARAVRDATRPDFSIVTPGIRLAGGEVHDQARVTTPSAAVEGGSDYLVVGRAVTRASDPAEALARVRADIAAVVGAAGA